MTKLLRAGFHRYTHSLLFWICMLICVGTGVLLGVRTSDGWFSVLYYLYLILLNASLVSLLIGREFGDGMFRAKIVVGHPKGLIFLSEAILALAVTLLMYLIHAVLILTFNLHVLRYIDITVLPIIFVGVLLTTLAFTALFVMLSCLISKRAIAPVIGILLVVALSLSTFSISDALSEPKMNEYMVLESEPGEESRPIMNHGGENWIPMSEPNPRYVDEPLRGMLEWMEKVSPFGQFSSYARAFDPMFMLPYITETNRPAGTDVYDSFLRTGVYTVEEEVMQAFYPLPIYQLVEIFVCLGVGYLLFRKKDFK